MNSKLNISITREQVNFTHLSLPELYDWVDIQVQSGSFSAAQFNVFIELAQGCEAEEAESAGQQPTRINFIEKALNSIDTAIDQQQFEAAQQLIWAVNVMHKAKLG